MDKLKQASKISTTVRKTVETDNKGTPPPKGAEIIHKEDTTETREITNGWIISTRTEVRWRKKGSDDSYGNWYNPKPIETYYKDNPNPTSDMDDEIGIAAKF